MTTPLITTRDALAEVLHQAIRTTGPGIHCDRLADAILASGVVVTPAVYLAGLAEDEAVVETVARSLAMMEPGEEWPTNAALGGSLTGTRDDEYRDGYRDEAIDALAALAAALATPTTEDQ